MRRKYASLFRNFLASGRYLTLARSLLKYPALLVSKATGVTLTSPFLANLAVTYRCNARCSMCDFPMRAGREEYGTDRMKSVIDDLAGMGIESIAFTGGEPLLRKDIFTLIEHVKSRGALAQMATNGLTLNKSAAEKLVTSGLDALTISIDGATPQVHDRIRGVTGAFDRAVAAARNVLSAKERLKGNLSLSISAVIVPDNVDQLHDIVDLAHSLGVDNVSFFSAEGIEDNGSFFSAGEREKIIRFLESLLDKKGVNAIVDNSRACLQLLADKYRGKMPWTKCMGGYTTISIDCYGNVFSCYMGLNRGTPIASLEKSSLKDIWSSEKYRRERKRLLNCHECHYVCHMEINTLFYIRLLARSLLEG